MNRDIPAGTGGLLAEQFPVDRSANPSASPIRTVFLSHSQFDDTLLPWFERIFSSLPVELFHMEFEKPMHPQNQILEAIKRSEAVFVLLSPQTLEKIQTVSWVVAETTLGYILNKPTFLFAQRFADVPFPLPYFSTYTEIQPEVDKHFDSIRDMVAKGSYQYEIEEAWSIHCPYPGCEAESKSLNKPVTFIKKCPVCVRPIKHYAGKQYAAPPT